MTRRHPAGLHELSGKRLAALLALVTLDDEVVGVLGRGYPTSFYRIHICAGGHWYGLEHGAMPARLAGSAGHPIAADLALRPEQRAAVVWGRLRDILSGYQTMPGREAMAALLARGRELQEQKRAAWALHDAGLTPGGAS